MRDLDRRHLLYIRESIRLIEDRTRSGREAFLNDVDQQDAVLWRLYTLADSTLQLSEELRARHPAIPWTRIRGFRNIAAHGYQELLLELTWEIVEGQLSELRSVVDAELAGSTE